MTQQQRAVEAWVPVAVLAGVFALAASTLGQQDFWMDEFYALYYIDRPFLDAVRTIIQPQHNGPLFFLLLWGWRHLVGTSEYALRYLSLLEMLLALAGTWRLARDLAPARVAHAAVLLLACAPLTLYYAQEAKMYALFMALAVLSTLALWRALRRNRWPDWLRYVLLFNLLGYSHFFGVFTVATQALLVLWDAWRRPSVLRAYLLTMVLAALPYVPVAFFLLREFPSMAVPVGLQHFLPLPQLIMELLTIYGPRLALGHLAIGPYIPVGVGGLALVGLGVAWRRRPSTALWAAALTWLPALIYYPLSFKLPLFTARYFIAGMPFFVLSLAWLVQIRPRVVGVVVMSALLTLYAWADLRDWTNPLVQRPQWRRLAAYLEAHSTPQDVIVVHNWFAAPLLEHYYHGVLPIRPFICASETCSAYNPEPFFAALADAGYRNVWLVLYQDQALTPDHEMTQRLAARWPTLLPWTDLYGDLKLAAYTLNPRYTALPTTAQALQVRCEEGWTARGVEMPVRELSRSAAFPLATRLHLIIYWEKDAPDARPVPLTGQLRAGDGRVWGQQLEASPAVFERAEGTEAQLLAQHVHLEPGPALPSGLYTLELACGTTAFPAFQVTVKEDP